MLFFDEKKCNSCNETKKIENFYVVKKTGNLQGDCKICYQAKRRAKRKENIKNGKVKYTAKKKKCLDCENLCDARKKVTRCHSCNNRLRHMKNPGLAKEFGNRTKQLWRDEKYREKKSLEMKKNRLDGEFNKKLCNSFSRKNRLSSVHKKIKQILNLEERGFLSEQCIGKYFVDEINYEKKIILEINGDYVHANPKYYKQDDIIRLPNTVYTAAEKWESDNIKINNLISLGYEVIVIWETDDLQEVNNKLT